MLIANGKSEVRIEYMNDVAFIIPAYNAEKTIERCIDSIIQLNLKIEYEILIVDDGSIDNTGIICRAYEESINQIRYIRKPNGGVSSARNMGITETNSDWIVFVDADDYILPGIVNMINRIHRTQADILFCNYLKFEGNCNLLEEQYSEDNICFYQLELSQVVLAALDYKKIENVNTRFNSPWAKMFRKDIIDQYIIKFDETIVIAEDFIFNLEVYSLSSGFEYVNTYGYAYYVNDGSASRKYQDDIVENNIRVGNRFVEIKKYYDKYSWFDNAYNYSVLKGFLNIIFLKYYNSDSKVNNRIKKKEITELIDSYPYKLAFVKYKDIITNFSKKHRVILYLIRKRCFLLLEIIFFIQHKIEKLK